MKAKELLDDIKKAEEEKEKKEIIDLIIRIKEQITSHKHSVESYGKSIIEEETKLKKILEMTYEELLEAEFIYR